MPSTDFCHLIRETFTRAPKVPGPLLTAHTVGAPLEVWASKDLVGQSRGFTAPREASDRHTGHANSLPWRGHGPIGPVTWR